MDNKVVFISHSSKDFEFANKVCSTLENCSLPCWIAPRDIPYGDTWSEKIALAINNAKVMVFVLSEKSNKSVQVINEINLALKKGLKIIVVRITDINCNLSLEYYLSTAHWLNIDSKRVDEQLIELANRITLYTQSIKENNFSERTPFFENMELTINNQVNIDDEIDSLFDEIIEEAHNTHDEEAADEIKSFKNKLLDRIAENISKNLFIEETEATEETEDNKEAEDNGRYFTVNESKHEKVTAIICRRKISSLDFIQDFTGEILDKSTEELSFGRKKVCFYVDNPDREGNPITIVTFLKNKGAAVVGMGFLDGESLKISRKMKSMSFTLSDTQEGKTRYKANKSGKMIIDPDTGLAVERKEYFNHETNKWEHYVDLFPYKRYFVVNFHSSTNEKADPFFIGYGYYKGCYGLKQNTMEAAVWFEKAGTKDAYYYLAQIFKDDPLLENEDDYNYYMNLYNS